jgi:hypothetical protein
MRRKRIDWDEEIRKTEQIRWRGIRFSLASFALALFWIFGVGRMGRNFSLAPLVALVFFVSAGTLLFIMLMRRRK